MLVLVRSDGGFFCSAEAAMKKNLRIVLINIAVLLAIILFAEGALRAVSGAPHGRFKGWFSGRLGMYPENFEQPNYGVTNWVVKTNAWGFRGDEVALEKTPGRTRIVMLGDSITDGFYVENAFTYPAFVQDFLREKSRDVEVINGACGGATINKELAIFKDVMTPFKPDIVVLTFVTNDVDGLKKVSDEQLLGERADNDTAVRKVLRFLFVYTAVGELVLDNTLRFISEEYDKNQKSAAEKPELDPDRYTIPGGDQYAANAAHFMKRYANADAEILQEPFSPEVQRHVARYLLGWDAFVAHARQHNVQPVFVYMPAYPQIYDPSVSMHMRDILQEHSSKAGVPFLDMTPVLRKEGATRILHQAPKDYHHNPDGNRVIGQALADFLLQSGLVK